MPTPENSYSFAPNAFPYTNREALLDDYTPETLVGRDDELDQYHAALTPAINGEQPNNIFLYGKAGVGKTASTRFLLNRLQQDASEYDINICTETLNCDGHNSSYRAAVALVNAYRNADNQISETGYARAQVYNMLWEELDAVGGLHIIVLDEVDHLKDDSLLYQLSRARDNENLTDARVAAIGISNDLTFRDSLSPKVRSSLCERAISFSAYDAGELRAVLDQRQQVAFQDDALADDVLPLCAAYGAQESGDARKALDLLLKAGDKAREDDADLVTDEHVREGRKMLEREQIQRGIMDLNEHERLILYALATFEAEGDAPVQSRTHYKRYKALAERAGRDVLTERWMREQTDELDMLGLATVEEQNEGRGGGVYREHERLILYALATFEAEGDAPVQSRTHYKRYKALAERAGRDVLTERWMREQTDELDMLGLATVEEQNEGRGGGVYREHELRQDLGIVLDALGETIEQTGVHESVRQYTSVSE